MLDRHKLLGQIDRVSKDIFQNFAREQDIAQSLWHSIKNDLSLSDQVHAKKYSLLLPRWDGSLGFSKKVSTDISEYSVLAVDGSQIYYDKHQGPGCYLINVGTVLLDYGLVESSVALSSYPYLFMVSDTKVGGSTEFINLQREAYEFEYAAKIADQEMFDKKQLSITMFDGSLIFFQLDTQGQDQKQEFLQSYLGYLDKFYEKKQLITGYMSFPRTRELVNILRLVLAQFDEQELQQHTMFEQLTDMDIAQFFLKPGYRSTVFQSKAPISYLYPDQLKPYFCYMNVGYEIVRLEFPAWIAKQSLLIDQVCQLSYDQAQKGRGYPVCLFEAHEQAVVKSYDREFFYAMIRRKIQQYNVHAYQKSLKSLKKEIVPV